MIIDARNKKVNANKYIYSNDLSAYPMAQKWRIHADDMQT